MTDHEQPTRRAMVVIAHPDDAEWICAGTVAKWCAEVGKWSTFFAPTAAKAATTRR